MQAKSLCPSIQNEWNIHEEILASTSYEAHAALGFRTLFTSIRLTDTEINSFDSYYMYNNSDCHGKCHYLGQT